MQSVDVVELTGSLVGIDSQNPGPGEPAIAAYVERWAVQYGIDCLRLEPVTGRPNLLLTVDRGPGPHLALCGHLDTKPVGDARSQWRTDPHEFVVEADLGFGLGASDMKAAIAAMLCTLREFAAQAGSGLLSVLLTADEEQGSEAGAKALTTSGMLPRLDAMVIGEPSGIGHPWEALYVVSRGICVFDVVVRTRQGHSGLSRQLGRNAVLVAADVLRALEDFTPTVAEPLPFPTAPTVNPGMLIDGGVTSGTWPGECTVTSEIRLVPGMRKEQVRAELEALVHRTVEGQAQAQIRYRPGSLGWMPAAAVPADAPVVAAAQHAAECVLGAALPIAAYPGGTDAAYFLNAGIPAVSSFGPGWLSVAHGPNESVGISQIHQAVRLYTALATEFLGPEGRSA